MNDTPKEETNIFDLDLSTYEFTLTKKGQDPQMFVMTELTGKQRDTYMTNMTKNMDMRGDTPKLRSFEGLQAFLLSLSVTYASGPKSGSHISTDEAQSWPAKLQKLLFERAQIMSGLAEEEDEEDEDENEDGSMGNE